MFAVELVIDSVHKLYTINGVAADFSGRFPTFPKGENGLDIYHDFTSATYDTLSAYDKRY